MKKILYTILLFILLLLYTGRGMPAAYSGMLTVETNSEGPAISPLLYGAFLEDINHAADGGLYAEMVRNRSFEFLRRYTGWQRIYDRNMAEIVVENKEALNKNNIHYIKLNIFDESGEVGLRNYGYDGMAIKEDGSYRFSVYARCEDNFDGFLRVILENEEG